jgi:hypothetical protein
VTGHTGGVRASILWRLALPLPQVQHPPIPRRPTPDQAAITAVQARGLPCNIPKAAEAERLGTSRIAHASMVVNTHPA